MLERQLKWFILSASLLVILAGILDATRADDGESGIHAGSGRSIRKKGEFSDNSHDEPPKKRHRLNPNFDPSEHRRFGGGSKAGDFGLGVGRPTTRRPMATTQPDWDYICFVLCGVGDGGLACDCDILPIGG